MKRDERARARRFDLIRSIVIAKENLRYFHPPLQRSLSSSSRRTSAPASTSPGRVSRVRARFLRPLLLRPRRGAAGSPQTSLKHDARARRRVRLTLRRHDAVLVIIVAIRKHEHAIAVRDAYPVRLLVRRPERSKTKPPRLADGDDDGIRRVHRPHSRIRVIRARRAFVVPID